MKKIVLTLAVLLTFGVGMAFAEDGKINLNAATVEQLAQIEGLNEEIATEIVDVRTENEEFVDFAELLDINGIDNALLRKLEQSLFIEPAAACAGC